MAHRERLTPALLMTGTVALTVSLIVACSGQNPAAPGNTDNGGTGGDGTVTASCPGCFPVPGPVPGGNPQPIPVPGAPGAPTGGPTPNPSASPSPGGGGGGASPSPTPTATPTPTPTCTLGGRVITKGSPTVLTGGGGSATVGVSFLGDADNCRITELRRVTARITTSDVSLTFGGAGMRMYVTLESGPDNSTQTLMDAGYRPSSLTGSEIGTGTACNAIDGFTFGTGGTDLTAATAPYAGTFDPTSAGGNFDALIAGYTGATTVTVGFLGLGADAVLECLQVEVVLGPL